MIMQKHGYPNEEEGMRMQNCSAIDKSSMLACELLIDSNFYKIRPRNHLTKSSSNHDTV